MATKANLSLKRQKKLEKRAKVEKATNWFMINLAWGVLAFLALRYLANPLSLDFNEFVDGKEVLGPIKAFLGKFSIVLIVVAVLLLVWGLLTKFKTIKCPENAKSFVKKLFSNPQRFINYGIFAAVASAVVKYLSVYNKVRMQVLNKFPSLRDIAAINNQNFWITDGISYAIGAYLVVAFIYTAIKIAIIEHKK